MKVGLVLAGGAGKGAYQIGALKAISKYVKPEDITVVCSSSIGAINSYAYVTGRLGYAEKQWRSINIISKNLIATQLLNSEFLFTIFAELAKKPVTTPRFLIPLLNLRKRTLEYMNLSEVKNSDEIRQILRASVAIPPICKSVKVGEKHYLDGAIVESIPVKKLEEYDLDYIICVYFDKATPVFQNLSISKKVIKICFDDETRVANSVSLSKKNVNKMLARGQTQTGHYLDYIFREGTDNLPVILKAIHQIDQLQTGGPKKVLTTSRGLGVLNSVTKVIIKH